MKKIVFSPTFNKKLKSICHKDKQLTFKIFKQLKIFQTNPQHPSLRIHKLKGQLQNVWSMSVTTSFRLIFIEDTEYYFFDMGEHNDIYR